MWPAALTARAAWQPCSAVSHESLWSLGHRAAVRGVEPTWTWSAEALTAACSIDGLEWRLFIPLPLAASKEPIRGLGHRRGEQLRGELVRDRPRGDRAAAGAEDSGRVSGRGSG